MKKIKEQLLNEVSRQAAASPRRRMNYNFHKEYSDPLQRMLNAVEPQTYIQPHKHEDPDKTEVFFALRGRIAVIEFDDLGNITDHMLLDPAKGSYGAEIPQRIYHTIIALDEGTVAYEIKNGPYAVIDDKNFASWAPKEGSADVAGYLAGLLAKTGIPG
ncbi:MAG: WbuC family cupin fold metalloprotein [Bacteroidetes bacterium]|nr:WbuC family cupin fold metalloprotein [Bacteroidota bacterium]